MTAIVFPGQGSQFKGMGKELFSRFPDYVKTASDILGYSIDDLCLNDAQRTLSQTQFTQPALYTVNCLSYLQYAETGKHASYFAGHSLGEYSALFAAEVFNFETGLQLVKERGRLMSEARGGGMAAILGIPKQRVQEVLQNAGLIGVDIANDNCPTQIVIAAKNTDINAAKKTFERESGVTFIPLNVSAPFHSRYMIPAKESFRNFLEQFDIRVPVRPVISNVNASPYSAGEIKDILCEQIAAPVRWTETIVGLLQHGVSDIVEVGPGDVLSKLVLKIKAQAEIPVLSGSKRWDSEITLIGNSQALSDDNVNGAEPLAEPKQKANQLAGRSKVERHIEITRPQRDTPTIEHLGCPIFKETYNLKHAYMSGGMVKAIASRDMVVSMAKAGFLGALGTGGVPLKQIESDIAYIKALLPAGQTYVVNLLCNLNNPTKEQEVVDILLKQRVPVVEAAAFMQMTPALITYRLNGLRRDSKGGISIGNRIIAKISRPEIARAFLSPPPRRVVEKLLAEGRVTSEQAKLAERVPMADDLCVEADSGGHTDQGVASVLIPAICRLRDSLMTQYPSLRKICVGAGGGIGSPEAAASAFMLGADFVLTGSINQCTVEAHTSDAVKDILQAVEVQDTDYAPAGDMFEIGAQVQVVKRGLFFPARGRKLYSLYQQFDGLDAIDVKTQTQIQEKYFRRSFSEVWQETQNYYQSAKPDEVSKAETLPKHKMALIFRWYFIHSMRLAMQGVEDRKVDYQIHCGPAMGVFNHWVQGSTLESWKNRKVDLIAMELMQETKSLLNSRWQRMLRVS